MPAARAGASSPPSSPPPSPRRTPTARRPSGVRSPTSSGPRCPSWQFSWKAEHDVLAYMTFPKEHRQKLHSTNPIERLHAEVKRRTNVVGIFPNEAAIRLAAKQNDEWAVRRASSAAMPSRHCVWGWQRVAGAPIGPTGESHPMTRARACVLLSKFDPPPQPVAQPLDAGRSASATAESNWSISRRGIRSLMGSSARSWMGSLVPTKLLR